MSPVRTGLFASAGLAVAAWCFVRLLGPRPLRRLTCAAVPNAWLQAIGQYATQQQYTTLTQALCARAPLDTEAAYTLIAQYVTPAQLQAITSDPAWVQGQLELVRGGYRP